MSLAKKYGLSEETFKKMVQDGILPCSIVRHNEMVSFYSQKITAGIPKPEAMKLTSEEYDIHLTNVYKIINRFGD